jgi:hypothetical protein
MRGVFCSAAKAYLQRVRELDAAQRSSDEEDDESGGGDRHAQLSERLRRDALEVTLSVPSLAVGSYGLSDACWPQGAGKPA